MAYPQLDKECLSQEEEQNHSRHLNPSHASPQSLKEAANQQRGSLDYFANKWKGI
jgi:hypothetical protein